MKIGQLRDRVRIEQQGTVTDSTYGPQPGTWTELATVMASVLDVLPSRRDRSETVRVTGRSATVRMRYRTDVTPAMRLVLLDRGNRVLRIVQGPAQVGNREAIELLAEEFTTQGDAP